MSFEMMAIDGNRMIKLQIGGSPCTYWSIAQTRNRETEPSGMGWELFENYLIALEKFKPNFFLYENNKSMSAAIRAEITKRFGFEPVCINSSKLSAQNRQRIYWCGKRNPDGTYSAVPVKQPEDKGILLRDILDSGTSGSDWDSKQYRGYSPDEKSVTLCGQGGGIGAKTGLYAVPSGCDVVVTKNSIRCQRRDAKHSTVQGTHVNFEDGKSQTVSTSHVPNVMQDVNKNPVKSRLVYEVKNGLITINGKQYAIKLADGFYIIRKLTVTECKRLQTVPDNYVFPVSDTQAYKMLGNGWTVDVIAHILSHCHGIASDPLDVLSVYDGMACGHIALDKLGAHISRYRAFEIDKYAIKTACHNFPDIEQIGDAFQVREPNWKV